MAARVAAGDRRDRLRRRAAGSQPDTRSRVEKRWATVLALLPSVVLWAMLSSIILGYGRAHALIELSAGTVALAVLLTYATLAWRGALAPARFLRGTWFLAAFMVAIVMVSGIAEAHQ